MARRERVDVAGGTTSPPPVACTISPQPESSATTTGVPAEQRFERHEPEDFVLRRIDEHVGVGERLEPVAAAQQAGEDRASIEAERAHETRAWPSGPHVVAGDHQPRVGRRSCRERAHEHVDTLARRQLAEKHHERRAVRGRCGGETRRAPRDCENSSRSTGFGMSRMAGSATPSACNCCCSACGDRQHARGAGEDAVTDDDVEDALGQPASLDPRRGSIGCEHVRYAGAPQMVTRQSRREGSGTHGDGRRRTYPHGSPYVGRGRVGGKTASGRPDGSTDLGIRAPPRRQPFGRRHAVQDRNRFRAVSCRGNRVWSSQASVVHTVTWWPRRARPRVRLCASRGMPPYAHASAK